MMKIKRGDFLPMVFSLREQHTFELGAVLEWFYGYLIARNRAGLG